MKYTSLAVIGLSLAAAITSCSSTPPPSDESGSGGASVGSGGACPAGQTLCFDNCVSLSDNAANCGSCGRACGTGATCVAGACVCGSGLTECGGLCVNLAADGANCGSCGNVCEPPLVCSQGQCSAGCAAGLTQCGSSCVDLNADVSNCGTCGQTCPAGQACIDGSCGCGTGLTLCAGVCTDTLTDPSNCGVCGNVCTSGSCAAGQCSSGVAGTGGSGTGGVQATGGTVGTGGSGTGGVQATGGTGGTGGTPGGTGGSTGGAGGTTGGTGGDQATGGDGTGGEAPTCDESTITDSPNMLGVNVTTAEHVVHKEIFGLLMEDLGNDVRNGVWVGTSSSIPNTNGVRNDIIEGSREAGVGAIEWPGGCHANHYNWEANLNPSNNMGTDTFMEFATAVGAEPVLVGRPEPTYADSNRRWIEYVNDNSSHPEWTVKYFKIGNEVWGCGGDLGHEPAGESTYESWYNANYDVLNTPVNGKELFLIGATAGIWTIDPNNSNDWINLMLGSIGDRMSGIEIHDYIYYPDSVPCVGFSDSEYYDILYLADEGQLGPRLRDIRTIMDSNDPSGRIRIIEDEWGDWLMNWNASDDWLQQNTVMDAISAAITLNLFIRNADRVQMAGLAQAVNVIHSLFLTNSSSGGTDLVKTPTFYVFKMLVPHHTNNARYAPVTLSSEQISEGGHTFNVLSSAATVNDAGQVSISLANVDLVNTRDVTITLDSATASYAMASAQVITGPGKDSYNDFGQPETVNIQTLDAASYKLCGRKLKVTLPTKSVVMLTLDPR